MTTSTDTRTACPVMMQERYAPTAIAAHNALPASNNTATASPLDGHTGDPVGFTQGASRHSAANAA